MAEALNIDEENARVIAEIQKGLTEAPEPGTAKVGHVEHQGNNEAPAPIIQTTVSSAGYVYIWDRYSGDRSLTNRNMLSTQLKKKHSDGPHKGEFAFTTADPHISTKRNRLKCRLHADDEERPLWDQMGFAVCPKSNLVSIFHRDRHMRSKHKDEWAAIQDAEYRRRDDEEKEFRRTLMEQVARGGGTNIPMAMVEALLTRRAKNPNRVAAGKATAAKLRVGVA